MAGNVELDSRLRIVTPENIAFEYRLAGPFWRLPAYVIDLVVRAGILLVVALVATTAFSFLDLAAFGWVVLLVSWFVLEWFYGGLCETFWNGQTPGKKMLRLRVLSANGEPINALQAILRNVLRFVDAVPVVTLGIPNMFIPTFTVGLLAMGMSRRFQRLGDLACGTIVVVEERERFRGMVEIEEDKTAAVEELIPPAYVVPRSLAAVLNKYMERRKLFSEARRAEISQHLGLYFEQSWHLPPGTDHDALMCALYKRAFHAAQNETG